MLPVAAVDALALEEDDAVAWEVSEVAEFEAGAVEMGDELPDATDCLELGAELPLGWPADEEVPAACEPGPEVVVVAALVVDDPDLDVEVVV